jgi:hypothetical protein
MPGELVPIHGEVAVILALRPPGGPIVAFRIVPDTYGSPSAMRPGPGAGRADGSRIEETE